METLYTLIVDLVLAFVGLYALLLVSSLITLGAGIFSMLVSSPIAFLYRRIRRPRPRLLR